MDTNSDAIRRALYSAGAEYGELRIPIDNMKIIETSYADGLASDGLNIYFSPESKVKKEDVLHLLIHCICRHMLVPSGCMRAFWDIACDISAEYIRTEMFPGDGRENIRMRIKDILPEFTDPSDAGAVYRALMEMFEDELESAADLVRRDSHKFWGRRSGVLTSYETEKSDDSGMSSDISFPGGDEENMPQAPEEYIEWLEEKMDMYWPSEDEFHGGKSVSGQYGLSPGCREEKMLLRARARYDFSGYLKRFSTTREEIRTNQAEFDFIPYVFGLERYGNMPLIEPLEYTESHKVEDLVIAIDTSGSCSLPVVERFFAEIERILLQKENFFRSMNVHILQCDARIQSHIVIHSVDEWKKYTDDLSIRGRGGTDFNPVFDFVEKLRKKGQLKSLKGLLYFTDGNGVYPGSEPDYETAFVFTSRDSLRLSLPEWIIPLCLDISPELLKKQKTGN